MSRSTQGVTKAGEDAALKTYYGRAATAQRDKEVLVRNKRLVPLAHHVRHSPTGFGWGYAGSGPADLSRSILLDAFGTESCPAYPGECECSVQWVEPAYQGFNEVILASLASDEDWKLQQGMILDWTFDYLKMRGDLVPEEPVPVPS